MHTFIVRNLSGTFVKEIRAKSAADACIQAFDHHGAHHRSRLFAEMVQGKPARNKAIDASEKHIK